MTDSDLRESAWNQSYERRENFLFWPHEDVIRFFAARIAKRTGLHDVMAVHGLDRPPRVLDLGCGVGRHVIFAHDMGCDAYGIDLSQSATKIAKNWASESGADPSHIVVGSADKMPYDNGFFDFVISHGVLDSMPFEIARHVVVETHRVLSSQGRFYCDLISGDDSRFAAPFSGEIVVDATHEQNTIQSFFDEVKLRRLFEGLFAVISLIHKRAERIVERRHSARWHVELRPI